MIRFFLLSFVVLIFLFFSSTVNASSSYVLPYPSTMPGTFTYKVHVMYERLLSYWYFGDFAQFDYNLKLSDKYLVEAKTLFEYKQYLLGFNALKKSNEYFLRIRPFLIQADKNGKVISEKKSILDEAALKHTEVLESLYTTVPGEFTWTPEKSEPTHLPIQSLINEAIRIRKNYL